MNKKTFKQIRHNIRASGWQWNWGSKVSTSRSHHPDGSYGNDYKSKSLALAAGTILHVKYDQPLPVDTEATDSVSRYMRLIHEWNQHKARNNPHGRTLIWWRNYMRANVRQDSRVFTHQLWPV